MFCFPCTACSLEIVLESREWLVFRFMWSFALLFSCGFFFKEVLQLSFIELGLLGCCAMLVRMWQNIKLASFLCRRKIYTSSHLLQYQVVYFFMSRWKFTHQVYYIVISCQFFLRKYIFVDQVSLFDIKFLIFVWNTIFPLPSRLRRRNKKYMSSF